MKTKLGVVGVGGRGKWLLSVLLGMEDVEVCMVCDLKPDLLEEAAQKCLEAYGHNVDTTTDYSEMLAREEIQGIVIPTSWNAHIPLAIQAMRSGKYAAFEVGPAQNLGQVYDLVRTYEETGVPCMMLENCCYGEKELMMKRMIQAGVFGELIHCRGGYEHDLRGLADGLDRDHERSFHNLHRNGDVYLTHELGPIINWLNINRGNRIMTLSSMSTKARGLAERYAEKHDGKHLDFKMGDMTTTMLTCANGETILLTHNVCSPRPYSRGGQVQGTRGLWMEDNASIYIEGRSEEDKWEPMDNYKEYAHPLWQKKEQFEALGHGGMDYLVLRAFIEAVRNHTQTPIDVYDTATMLAVSALSEISVSEGGTLQAVPDLTSGRWVHREEAPKSIYSLDIIHDDLFEGELNL